jgi:hypothetical protein
MAWAASRAARVAASTVSWVMMLAQLLDQRLIPEDEMLVRQDGRRRWLFATSHHVAIAEALHLDPEYLCGGLD